tara:strand:- start:50 stop:1207 length:1158 start_codon:yes stop_codon:yes gene_type:complete
MDSKNYPVNKANSWNGWDPLKQVVLGNVFDPDFFEDIGDPKLRDLLQRLLYETHEDLMGIKKTLEDLGVEVVQPPRNSVTSYAAAPDTKEFSGISEAFEYYKDSFPVMKYDGYSYHGVPRPCLMPRDYYVTIGDKILFTGHLVEGSKVHKMFNPDIIDYWPDKKLINRNTGELANNFWAPQIVRVGDKLIIDEEDYSNLGEKVLERYPIFKGSKITVGGHTDGCMNLPKPGLVICAPWMGPENFKDSLPGWDVFRLDSPNFMHGDDIRGKQNNEYISWENEKKLTRGRWWHPEAKSNPDLVKYVDEWLNHWVGFAEETMFEVNMLSVSEEVILSMNYQKDVHTALKKHGIEAIYCRFRHRNFWDGGLHCLTLDTVREGGMQCYLE